jgi:succinylglutamate desuccinylase
MFEKITQINGIVDGPTSIILAGVHGDEKCGIDAFKKIVPNLRIEKGTVLFGYGNPRAIEKSVRFVDVNLNRMFKDDKYLSDIEKESYEYKRAQFLKKYLSQADALLDVHASNTKDSTPFIICEANALNISQYLPVNLQVSGFDNVEPGGTDYYMNSIGKIGICVECGYIEDPKSTEIAAESIFAFLKARGHIKNDTFPTKRVHIQIRDLYKTKTNNFTLSKTFKDFEQVVKDQVIGIDGSSEIKAERNGVILFARNRNQVGSEAFLFGEKK